jgi:ELWxxDGT repeat protein
MGSRLLFCTQTQLMISDGTTAGTDSLLAINTYSQGFGYCELNNKVYFVLPGNNGQQEIWRTDGTATGTQLVLNLTTALNIISTSEMIAFNGKLYLTASISGQGSDLFVFDGNIGGQIQRVNLVTGANAYPGNFTLHDNSFYFTASNLTTANLYRISGANSTPQELIQNASFGWLNTVTFANNSVYFLTDNQQQIHRIDLNNLIHSVTQLHGYSMPYYFDNKSMLVGSGGNVFMAMYDSTSNKQVLFEANETLTEMNMILPNGTNTTHPFNFLLGCGTADIFDFKMWNNQLILPANFNDAGRELWIFKTDDLTSEVEQIGDDNSFAIFPNPANNELNVTSLNNGYCDQQVNIANATGEIVIKKMLNGGTTSIKLFSLASGNYFATLTENGKAISTKKLVLVK